MFTLEAAVSHIVLNYQLRIDRYQVSVYASSVQCLKHKDHSDEAPSESGAMHEHVVCFATGHALL